MLELLFKILKILVLSTLLGIIGPFSVSFAQETAVETVEIADLPKIQVVRVTSTPVRARLIVDLSNASSFSFVSLKRAQTYRSGCSGQGFSGEIAGNVTGESLVGSFSGAQLDQDRYRTVMVLNSSAQVQQAYILEAFDGQPARLVVDIIGATDDIFSLRVEADRLASLRAGHKMRRT